ILWAEGAGKLSYTPGQDSCGASLQEMIRLCAESGMHNAVNMDGGGSAQILLESKRALKISDRKTEDNSEAERGVPIGLIIR
ncbi:MAG: phosphodiester glycosidase family protein, partial [Lachnospiraceae bacterium]|nr:phosphodiester glycosidase family protein [Lachnospiraceae bacterium]